MLSLELDKKQNFNGSKKLFPSNKESKAKMTNLICKRLSKASCNVMHAKGDPYVIIRGGSRAAATFKMERFMIIVNYYHKVLHLGCCSSPRSASDHYLDSSKGVNEWKCYGDWRRRRLVYIIALPYILTNLEFWTIFWQW